MKKLLLAIAFILVNTIGLIAQEGRFGLKAGYTSITEKISDGETSVSISEAGFYFGALADMEVSGKLHAQIEVLYANVESIGFLYIPLYIKYSFVEEEGFYMMAGPQANLILKDIGEGASQAGFDFSFGGGYEITKNFFIDITYSVALTNRLREFEGLSLKYNTFRFGVGYKFN